ncbi:hypothetical protein [Vibrio vulnificus]|uniref:hypothetical protein n=1 Tax=Vibrio vulnificus TaxID=672 RepID=UPI0010298184|nr:hypothetical protein [Vibrio vulnificus]
MNLSAWNAMSPISQRIKSTVDSWTDPRSDSFIPPEQRVAVFDLDGTLWCQKPILREWAFNIEQKISIHRFMNSLSPNSTAKCDTLQYQAANAISLKTIAGCLKPKHFFGR